MTIEDELHDYYNAPQLRDVANEVKRELRELPELHAEEGTIAWYRARIAALEQARRADGKRIAELEATVQYYRHENNVLIGRLNEATTASRQPAIGQKPKDLASSAGCDPQGRHRELDGNES